MSYKSQKFLFSIWVFESAASDSDRWSSLPVDPCELCLAIWAGAFLFGPFLEASEAEIVIAIVWARSLRNFFQADRAWVFFPVDLVHNLNLLLLVNFIEHRLVSYELLEELLLLQSHLFHLRLALIHNILLQLELL